MSSPSPDPRMVSTESVGAAQGFGRLPERIGRYHIKRVIASGGMGTVYEAEQERPRRTVALKVIRPGYSSPQLQKRFEQESQVLGRLQHPGIAQIYEAGIHVDREGILGPAGGHGVTVPYFAMEFIRGRGLKVFMEEENLGTRVRLELVAKVCDAVHHAHQKGVIHRDLKPGNILVDESGQPKILDFGVARATDSDIQATTIQTDVGQLIGTIPYMSPEQVAADPHGLDTRSDVYALGVITYEALAGRLPYDLKHKMIHEAARVIREEEPAPLSTVNRVFRGDVETIVAKSLEKDKTRRYQSAAELASDIRRYLHDEPIVARPASAAYQFKKFAQRNKAVVIGTAAVFLVLLVGMIVSTTLYLRAEREAERARRQSEKAEKFAEFMEQTLKGVGPSVALGRDNTMLKEVMDGAAKRITDGELKSAPEAELRLRMTIGNVYSEIAESGAAEKILEPTRELAEKELARITTEHSGDHPDLAQSLSVHGECLLSAGQRPEALQEFEKALAMRRRLFPGDNEYLAQSLNDVGSCLVSLNRRADALPYFEESLAMRKRLFPTGHAATVSTLLSLGSCLDWLGRFAESLPIWEEASAMDRQLHPGDHPDVVTTLNMLGYAYSSMSRYPESAAKYEEALGMQLRLIPGDHPMTATVMHNLGLTLDWTGRSEEAVPHLEEALAMRRRLVPGGSWTTALLQLNYAYGLGSIDRTADALRNFEESLAMFEATLAEGDWRIRFGEMGLASGIAGTGRFAEAEQILLPAWEAMVARKEIPGPYTRRCLLTLTKFYESWDAAEPGMGHAEKADEYRAMSESQIPRLEIRRP